MKEESLLDLSPHLSSHLWVLPLLFFHEDKRTPLRSAASRLRFASFTSPDSFNFCAYKPTRFTLMTNYQTVEKVLAALNANLESFEHLVTVTSVETLSNEQGEYLRCVTDYSDTFEASFLAPIECELEIGDDVAIIAFKYGNLTVTLLSIGKVPTKAVERACQRVDKHNAAWREANPTVTAATVAARVAALKNQIVTV